MSIEKPSLMSLLLVMKANGLDVAKGTGFLVKKHSKIYLITNRHNVRGRNNNTNELLSSNGAIPDEIGIHHNVAGCLGTWQLKIEKLYSQGTPLWLEHPQLGPKADVVALPLTNTANIEVFDYDPVLTGPAIKFGPTSNVSVIGFPFGLTSGGALGLWVNGTVASEPSFNFNDLPLFLIDCRTRSGQSGSPVILFRSGGMIAMQDGASRVYSGPVWRFVGVYSGRVNVESDLGIVWKPEVVEAILNHGIPGTP